MSATGWPACLGFGSHREVEEMPCPFASAEACSKQPWTMERFVDVMSIELPFWTIGQFSPVAGQGECSINMTDDGPEVRCDRTPLHGAEGVAR